MDSQAAAFSKAASLAFRKGSRNPQAAPLPPRPPREPTALLARESFKQAVRDVQAGQRYLRRDTPTRGPPKDSDNLWELFHSAAASLSTGAGSAVMRDPDNPHGKAPGVWSPRSDARAIGSLLLSSWLNLLCLAVPLGYIAHGLKWNAMAIFILNTIGLVPLALLLGEVTEDLALRFGDVIGGLLNATFGNVVELILSIAALAKGLFIIVAYSLIGSVLSNLLLVLGCCFLLGGTKYKQQSFNAPLNKASCALLFLAAIAITIPSAGPLLYGADVISPIDVIRISRGTAIMLVLVYLSYLYFQLKTHKTFYAPPVEEGETEQPALSLSGAMFMLGAITVIVALCSEFLTSALDDFSKQSGIHEAFLGLIILPIAGNACEHITAVIVAIKDKMDLSIAVALGSSIQISLFVLPVVVLVGWAIGKDFTLDIDAFLILMLTLAVIHAYFVSSDGNSNWLMGLQLVGTYILIALLVAFV
ncbi:hypothetical protein WJX72_007883 [[Myrmecia] bisecta]|uniref:Vacuolar cation/proton exchanger n=1 Tax=[Myrmecia] bisecta TaxID=41462 RepID=A0AAW1R838_9CHLO